MVLENVVVQVLNKFLGDYVENLDTKQLSLGIWGGSVELKNLILKQTALDDLNLPIRVVHGQLGELILKIPWKNLYGEPLVISVKDVYLVACPSQSVQYDEEKEEEWAFQAKQAKLQAIEESKKAASTVKEASDPGFVEKLVTQIINNVQLYIKNIHIRYEDKITNPGSPFCFGITLSDLHLASTDSSWQPAITKSDVTKIFKVVQLEGLSVYWNSKCAHYMNLPTKMLISKLASDIASKTHIPPNYTYLLGPINAEARLKLNKTPEKDKEPFSIPKVHLNFDVEKLYIGVTKHQYQDIVAFAESTDRMKKAQLYRKFRPQLPSYKGHYKEWWRFAITCVMNDVKRHRLEWSWEYINSHRNTCRLYADLYKKKLKNTLKNEEKLEIVKCEKKLDVLNIVLVREKVELEVKKTEENNPEKKATGWLSWMWGGSSSKSADTDTTQGQIMSQIEAAMTPNEKERLYAAIDYHENATPTNYPEYFIDKTCTFLLRTLEVELIDENAPIKRIILTELNGVKCRLDTRESANALALRVKIDEFITYGLQQDDFIPKLICSTTEVTQKGLLEVLFETNPMDRTCNQRVHIEANPVKLIYDGQTIIKLVQVFALPKSSYLDQLAQAAEEKLENIKEVSSIGIQHAIESRSIMDIKVDFKAPYLIIPQNGKFLGNENALVVNFGNLKFQSVERQSVPTVQQLFSQGVEKSEILKHMKEKSYDIFSIELDNLELFIANKDENWQNNSDNSIEHNMHILKPMQIIILLEKCLIKDPTLPSIKVSGQLEHLNISLSESRLFTTLSLLTTLPLPASSKEEVEVKPVARKSSSQFTFKYSDVQGMIAKKSTLTAPEVETTTIQSTNLDAKFVIKKLTVLLSKQPDLTVAPTNFLMFGVQNLELDVLQQTYMLTLSSTLEGISLTQFREKDDVKIISTPTTEKDGKNYLFHVKFVQINKNIPNFHTIYESCELSLILDFTKIEFILHQEGLISMITFANDMQEKLKASMPITETEVKTTEVKKTPSFQRRLSAVTEALKTDAPKKVSAGTEVIESVLFKLKVHLQEVSVEFASNKNRISIVAINDLHSELLMKSTYLVLKADLKNICVIDLNPDTHHNSIVTCPPDEHAIEVNVIKFDTTALPNKPDLSIVCNTGTLRIIFLNLFISRMLNFLSNFQNAMERISEASRAAVENAKENMQQVYEKATKIELNIDLKAPLIHMPTNSKSFNVITLDLGRIKLNNSFIILEVKDPQGHPAVIDDMEITLKDLQASRAVLNTNYEAQMASYLFEPVNIVVNVKRNLSTSWFTGIPAIDVVAKFGALMLLLSDIDYEMAMNVLSKNLAEAEQPDVKQPVQHTKTTASTVGTHRPTLSEIEMPSVTTFEKQPNKVYTFLNLTLSMEKIGLTLYTDEGGKSSDPSELTKKIESNGLARFSLDGISLKFRMMTDNCMVLSLLLVNCILDDLRRSYQQLPYTRLITRYDSIVGSDLSLIGEQGESSTRSEVSSRSMIDVTVQIRDNNYFIDTRVFSFKMIIAMNFMMRLKEFTASQQEQLENVRTLAQTSSGTSAPSSTSVVKPITTEQPITNEPVKNITINVKIEKPDIVLLENYEDKNTKALFLNTEVLAKIRVADKRQVINGEIKDIQLYTAYYAPDKRAESRYNVLNPFTISLAGSTGNQGGLNLELLVTDIRLRVSPATIQLLNRVLVTATSTEAPGESTEIAPKDYSDLWDMKPFTSSTFWYLTPDVAQDALGVESMTSNKPVIQEICVLSVPSIVITIEAGVGNKTLPMLLLESSLKGYVRNWSSDIRIESILTLQMGYYNSCLAVWEPLIEPCETVRDQRTVIQPWELKMEVRLNDPEITTPDSDEPAAPQAAMDIDISSDSNLELTVTKTSLDVLNTLSAAFQSAINATSTQTAGERSVACKFVNELGCPVTLLLNKGSFQLEAANKDMNVVMQNNTEVLLNFASGSNTIAAFAERLTFRAESVTQYIRVQIADMNTILDLPVARADKRYFPLQNDNKWGIISDIKIDEGVIVITIRSILQVHNHFNVPIDLYYMTARGNELELISTMAPGSTINIPLKAVYTPTTELFFSVQDYSVTTTPYVWKDLQTKLTEAKTLKCQPKVPVRGVEPFVIKVFGETEQVYFEQTTKHTLASTCYNIHLRPTVLFKNLLPYELICCVENVEGEMSITPGEQVLLCNVAPGDSCLIIRLPSYLEREWSTRQEILKEPNEFSVWSFFSYDGAMRSCLELGMHATMKNGSLIMELYCPFWMLNKTGLSLVYAKSKKSETSGTPRKGDENMNYITHPADFKGPILFSFSAKNFFGKKKAAVKIFDGTWSDKFSLDVAGSSGVVGCLSNSVIYQIGVSNQITYNGLTKQITFTPYYVVINNAPFAIECQESERPADPWVQVQPNSCAALWPLSELDDKLLRLRVVDTEEISSPFLYTESHNTLLKLKNKYGGVNVDIQLTEGGIYINIAPYEDGLAPALIVNNTRHAMNFWEKDNVKIIKLPSNNYMYFTWDNPSSHRVLVWEGGNKKEYLDDLRKDSCGDYQVADYTIYYASFLDGMQRILLFTEEQVLIEDAQAANLVQVMDREITISIHGIGLSIVNNVTRQEIMYLGIASSGIIWEHRKLNGRRFKPFGHKDNMILEEGYQQHLLKEERVGDNDIASQGPILLENKMEVNYYSNFMSKPHKRHIRRTFQTGLWFQVKSCPSQLQLHGKINRLQIDNQMKDSIFPIVLAPVPPPKSVAIDSGIKPFAEVSIVQLLGKNSQISQYKYFKVLVQEFHVKVDIGFASALMECLTSETESEKEEKAKFELDTDLVNKSLYDHVAVHSLREQKSFYDLLHFSPVKAHVSFSLAGGQTQTNIPALLKVLLQGIGVTLTDMQDVIFKLAYFQREYLFLTQKQLMREATAHYVGQTLKQLYVLVLGLDVLGNPYGLVLGITKGVEDLFYEPFQGAIQGPGEFAEGLAYGVRSLFGHTVGGAAGAVSRITGVMGKGVALLTFDEDYQKKRQDQLNKRPATVQEGIARSGKGLVMGVVDGVTGVFTKPISGAKEEGVGGFFKGLGKGAVGLVTRPTSGVVDFASGSLDVVKRATETGEETIRLRNPRYLQADGQVRPYNNHESFGYKLLLEMDKGKYANTDHYITHYQVIPKKEVLILTDKRMVYVTHNDLFGHWQANWSYTWQELKHPVTIVPKGLSITTDPKKKTLGIFGSNDHGKLILIDNPQVREQLCLKIESLRENA